MTICQHCAELAQCWQMALLPKPLLRLIRSRTVALQTHNNNRKPHHTSPIYCVTLFSGTMSLKFHARVLCDRIYGVQPPTFKHLSTVQARLEFDSSTGKQLSHSTATGDSAPYIKPPFCTTYTNSYTYTHTHADTGALATFNSVSVANAKFSPHVCGWMCAVVNPLVAVDDT